MPFGEPAIRRRLDGLCKSSDERVCPCVRTEIRRRREVINRHLMGRVVFNARPR